MTLPCSHVPLPPFKIGANFSLLTYGCNLPWGGGGAFVYLISRSAASGFRGILKHSMNRLWLEEKRWWVGAELTFCALNSFAAVKLLQDPVFWLLIPALSVLLRTMGNLRNTHYGRPFSILSRIP